MITIVNKRNFRGKGKYIGRPSPLGNPYTINKHGTREVVVELYRLWLPEALKNNDKVKEQYEKIKALNLKGNINLICWCAPNLCHGDVIKEMIVKEK
ncbi:MAG: DUF4326 domain-containing protein [Candidatus Heimdallarchaeota archaeon]|nr:DUF4326 domain-containing protein [Candidatus Heimdallarchaeota archaeon]